MNELETAIAQAIDSEGDSNKANKAYLEFIKANFMIPIEKSSSKDEPIVLYLEEDNNVFLPVFSNKISFDQWAVEIADDIMMLVLSGVDLLKGIGENIIVSLNIGSPQYKEFNPSELARMKNMVLKLWPNK
jgi:hypothetical protein